MGFLVCPRIRVNFRCFTRKTGLYSQIFIAMNSEMLFIYKQKLHGDTNTMKTLEEKYTRYLFRAAKVVRVLAVLYMIFSLVSFSNVFLATAQLGFSSTPFNAVALIVLILSSAATLFVFFTIAKVLNFLGDLAVWVTDLWERTEAIRQEIIPE